MKRILITGASGYIGNKLAAALAKRPDVACVVGVDVKPPPKLPPKIIHIEHDVRQPLTAVLREHDVDVVVHAAFVLPPIHDTARMEDINVNGTRTVLASCRQAGVSQVLYLSSATAYGFHPDNDDPLTESSPLRGNEDFTYSKCKRLLEEMMARFAQANPDMTVAQVRPCNVVGPRFDNPLSRYMEGTVVLLPNDTKPMQFVHENDLMEILVQLLVQREKGAFNVGGDGAVPPEQAVRMLGNHPVRLPFWLLSPLNRLAWFFRLRFITEFPSPAMAMVRHNWVVSSAKLIERTGFRYRYTSREAFEDYAKTFRALSKKARKLPRAGTPE